MNASALAWVGFAVSLAFVIFSIAAAVVFVLDAYDEIEERDRLDDLWDDGPEPAWLIRARYEIRDLPEVTA